MIRNKLKKLIMTIVAMLLLISNILFASAPDYMQGVDVETMDKVIAKIKGYSEIDELKKYRENTENKVVQKELNVDDTCNFNKQVIKCVEVKPDDKKRLNKIAITIDDSFSDEHTEEILDVLDKHNCKATFFITYKLLQANPRRALEIVNRGHELANHSMTHPPFRNLHSMRKIWEMNTMQDLVKTMLGINMTMMRFPTGSFDEEAIEFSKVFNMYPIGWSIDTRDWELKNTKKILDVVMKSKVKTGDIVLMHNGYNCSKEEFEKVLSYYESLGFGFLKTSELLYEKDFIVENGVQKLLR